MRNVLIGISKAHHAMIYKVCKKDAEGCLAAREVDTEDAKRVVVEIDFGRQPRTAKV